ncbi:MAG: TGS domain-containing protein [Halobacteriota archaeon]|nr:TGS domain-containing protein [Halobacteriota archaeon]
MSTEDKIREIEEEIRATPYNKSTEAHIGRLKAKLSKLKEERSKRGASKRSREGQIKKSGDATAVLVGFPFVGKSTLFQKLTGVTKEKFSDGASLEVIPGILEVKGSKIQILDLSSLPDEGYPGRVREGELLSTVRNADLILLVVDIFSVDRLSEVKERLISAAIRMNETPPNISISKRDRGGITINKTLDLDLDDSTILSILNEYKIHNADVLIRENITEDRLIDALTGNRIYLPAISIINKADLKDDIEEVDIPDDAILVSALEDTGLGTLKVAMFDKLEFIRIYMKPQGEDPDFKEPMIMKEEATVGDICDKIHRDFRDKFRHAYVWGKSAKHQGQKVGLGHRLKDEDVITIVVRR